MTSPPRKTPPPDGSIQSGNLAGRSLGMSILLIAGPIFLEQLLAATVGLVDKMLTGALPVSSTAALDGVGVGSYVGWFIGIAVSSVGIGSLAIISRAVGAGKIVEAERALGQAITFALLWGLVIAGLLWIGAPWLAKVSGLSPEATVACVDYIHAVCVGVPFGSVTFVGIMSLHGAGEAVRPFFIMLAVNVVNVLVSWRLSGSTLDAFGMTFASSGTLGVVGIGLGTAVARFVGAVLILGLMFYGVKDLKLRRSFIAIERQMLLRIVRVGVPAFLDGIGMWAGNIVVLGIVGRIAAREALEAGLGEAAVGLIGAHIIGVQWEAFSFLPGMAIGTAAATLAGQYLGAGNPRMATRSVWVCAIIAAVFMGSAGIAMIFGGEFLTRQISQDPLHLEVAPKLLEIAGFVQVGFAFAMVLREAMRGAGDTRWAMFITWFGTYAVRVPLAHVVGYQMGHGLVGVWLVLCGEIVFRSILYLGRFLHGGWRRMTV